MTLGQMNQEDVKKLIDDAGEQLTQCRDLRKRIQDPKIADTERVLSEDVLKHIHTYETEGRRPTVQSVAGAPQMRALK